jgi:cystathionine beta-lyase/cystathionine gamma-synthase
LTHEKRRLATRLIHGGVPSPRDHGAVASPIFQSATFEYGGEASYHDLKYIRLNNTPNHVTLAKKLAALEGAEAALVAASGMAAITTSLLAVLRAGDHVLVQDCLYGGTHDFVHTDLAALGVEVGTIDGRRPQTWDAAVRPSTRAVYFETLSNPLIGMPDLVAGVAFARRHGLVSMIDNTFPSPINFRPVELGFDLSLHSCTKYLNGHSDIVAGAVIGRAELVEAVRKKLNHLGGSLDPHACFLLERGMKTLVVRMRQHNENALRLARALEARPAVTRVHYPGLESHPDHARAAELLDGFGGMLSFELEGGREAADRLLAGLTIPIVAPSLGGIETLITLPATTSHVGMGSCGCRWGSRIRRIWWRTSSGRWRRWRRWRR